MGDKLFIIDADTLLVRASFACQQDKILVKHTPTGREREFNNKTEFWGKNFSKKDGGWLAEVNKDRSEKGLHPFSPDEFTVEVNSKIIEEDSVAFGRFKTSIEYILDNAESKDFRLVAGGDGNFRYDVATVKPYKGNRADKPLRFDATKEYMKSKYKDKVILYPGIEADDVVSVFGWWGYKKALRDKDIKANDVVLCACDKDLQQVPGWHLDYLKTEKIPQWVNSDVAARRFWTQMLTGDATDNIPGILDISKDTRDKYGLGNRRGVGAKTVETLFDGLETEREYYARVMECYETFYGDSYTYETHAGTEVVKNYKQMADEQYRLLRMMEERDVFPTLEQFERRLIDGHDSV